MSIIRERRIKHMTKDTKKEFDFQKSTQAIDKLFDACFLAYSQNTNHELPQLLNTLNHMQRILYFIVKTLEDYTAQTE
jgi:hypothetical protein